MAGTSFYSKHSFCVVLSVNRNGNARVNAHDIRAIIYALRDFQF